MKFSDHFKYISHGIFYYGSIFCKWVLISGIVGLVCGLVGSLFHIAVNFATAFRESKPWLLWLLPVCGVVIAGIYRITRMEGEGTNNIIDSIHFGDRVPVMLVPVIFVSTVLTHLCGGSAGREGAALQIGGGIGCEVGKLLKLDEKDMRLVTLCGMSAVFSALFGTPLTATIFALEVISVGVVYYSGFVPCILASLTAYGVSFLFGLSPTRYAITMEPLTVLLSGKVIVLSILCALVSIVFCEAMHFTERQAARRLANPFLRAAVGGAVLIALSLLLGTTAYNGAGGSVIEAALEQGTAPAFGFLWKILFTAITIGCGFRGGEIVPTFFIGACFGCVVGPLLGIPAGFAAAIGLVAIFCGAVNCPIASIILSVELFGSGELMYFAIACGISYMLSGYFGIYHSQKIMYSKVRAEFINRFAE